VKEILGKAKFIIPFAVLSSLPLDDYCGRIAKESILSHHGPPTWWLDFTDVFLSKYMDITAKPIKNKYLTVGNYRFEKVTEFKYLGTMNSYDNNLDIEIHHRLLLANRCYHSLKKQRKSLTSA
jgi:hypothetical protein